MTNEDVVGLVTDENNENDSFIDNEFVDEFIPNNEVVDAHVEQSITL